MQGHRIFQPGNMERPAHQLRLTAVALRERLKKSGKSLERTSGNRLLKIYLQTGCEDHFQSPFQPLSKVVDLVTDHPSGRETLVGVWWFLKNKP